MTKKKKLINGLIFVAGLIVLLIYSFEDNTDTDEIEKKQEVSAKAATDSMFNVFEDEGFEKDTLHDIQDSLKTDSL